MKEDKVLETFVPKREREVIHLDTATPEQLDELLVALDNAEWGKQWDGVPRRSLADIKIGTSLAPLDVDPKHTVANVEEPEKNIDWTDVKEKD